MLLNFTINNFKIFNSEVNLSLEADLRIKKLISNVVINSQGNALKSIAIYGPNNTGKTCIINAVRLYKSVLLNSRLTLAGSDVNLFSNSNKFKLGAEFLVKDIRYEYYFCYDVDKNIFCQEQFSKIKVDQYGNKLKIVYFLRNIETNEIESADPNLKSVINLSSKENILIYSLETKDFPLLQEAKDVLQYLANSLFILSMQRISPKKTIEILKNQNDTEAKQIIELIKSADLDIDDYFYADNINVKYTDKKDDEQSDSTSDSTIEKNIELLKLISIHHGMPLPSIVFDSNGTKKIISISGYLVHALNHAGILFLDELDCGIHFKLSRAIVSLFNSLLNESAQLICTTHDISLLDTKTLFRKEQLWFTDKDDKKTYLYSLADFTTGESGLRPDSNLYERYSKGLLGAVPDPSLIDFLLHQEGESDE